MASLRLGGKERSDVLSCHLPAFFGAVAAYFGTMTAMVGFVLFTFLGTGVADVGTGSAEQDGVLASHAHEVCSGKTGYSTFTVKLEASDKHLYIGFAQTGRRAVLTFGGACYAGVNTGLEFFVTHDLGVFGGLLCKTILNFNAIG